MMPKYQRWENQRGRNIEAKLTLNRTVIEQVDSFLYLESIDTKTGCVEEGVKRGNRQANGTFIQV
jgi:hypothetical protein